MKRIKKFGVMQTAKMAGVMYFAMSLIFALPMFAFMSNIPGPQQSSFPFGGNFMIFLPFIYGILGFIMTALMCLFYNLISGFIGGIEVEIETTEE